MSYRRGKGRGLVNGGRVVASRDNQSKGPGVNKDFCGGFKREIKDNQRALKCNSCEF